MLALIVSLVLAATPDQSSLRDRMMAVHTELANHFADINARSGIAADLEMRIDSDASGVELAEKPAWMSVADFDDYNEHLVTLDATLVDQLASGRYHDVASVRGADDVLYRAPADGTMQPLGVYVPASYDPKQPSPLVVMLHGRGDSENDMISSPWVRANAEGTGCIVIAPYARGDSQYVDPASTDVYAALDLARKAFNIDARRVYLAGHSMGGYGVFIVVTKHPNVWAGVLAASGGMVTEDLTTALKALQNIPVYLVVGSNDPIVPQGYMKRNYNLLVSSNIDAHYYEEPGGLHNIGTIKNAFSKAWHDMLSHKATGALTDDQPRLPTPSPQKP